MSRNPSSGSRHEGQVAGPVSGRPEAPAKHLNQVELADRWNISPRTLERWRWLGEGPRYLKLGSRIVYRAEDVEAFESANLIGTTDGMPARSGGRP